jgi:pimeloyl-ACP methyl ester carboxylesterase
MRAVLLLHGALGSKSQLEPIKELLASKGLTVFCLNFSGHSGEPFDADFGIQTFANNILAFVNRHNLEAVDIFGYSMGGYAALWLAHQHPERVGRIVTLGTKFDWSAASAEKETKKLNPDKIIEKVPAFARILETRHAPQNWKELLQKTAEMMTQLGEAPLLTPEILQQINHEVLVLLGDQDDMADKHYSKQVAHLMPCGEFKELQHTPHPIERVNREELIQLIVEHFTWSEKP